MGEYIYKTSPRLIQPEATIRLDTGEIVHSAVAGYVYAYKPWSDSSANKKLEAQHIAPARRAFERAGVEVPRYGAAIGDKAKGPAIGDRVFRTRRSVSLVDYYFDREGVIINLDGTEGDQRTLAQILDPANYGCVSIALACYIGGIIQHDYGFGATCISGDITALIDAWKAKLDPRLRSLFEQLERAK